MSNIDYIDAWKEENGDALKNISNYSSIIRHINSNKFKNSSEEDVVLYLKNIYDNINSNKNIVDEHVEPKVKVDIEYLSDKIDSIAMGLDKISSMLSEVLYNDEKISKSYIDLNELHNSFDTASEEIRKAVRMLKTKLGYNIITPDEKNRIYQTDEFKSMLMKCTTAGGDFEDCMASSLNEFLKERGLI